MRPVIALLLMLASAPVADAALIVTIGSTNVYPGTSGTVDVYVRSTTGTDQLTVASLQFQITPASPGATGLSFTNPQSDSHLTAPGYIFLGNSAAFISGPLPSSTISTTVTPDDTFLGGDGTDDFSAVLVPTTDRLLTRLDLSALLSAGGSFQISLVPASGLGGPFTVFYDQNFNPIEYNSTAGLITTPEPATMVVFGSLALAGFGAVRRRNRAALAA